MATDAPFGLSFGDPRKYIGSNPGIAEATKALKTGAAIFGLQQTGIIGALDKMGIKPNSSGGFTYNNPVAPNASASPTGVAMQPVPPVGVAAQPAMPNTNAFTPAIATPVYDSAAPPMSTTPPANIGVDVLDGKYHGNEQSFVNPQAQRDFNPVVPQTGYNQILATGNEYQQMPGYGKLAKAMQGMAGGMMG